MIKTCIGYCRAALLMVTLAPGFAHSSTVGYHDHSEVVGLAGNRGPGSFIGVLWRHGVMQNLNRLIPRASGWRILEASAINNSGVILAVGMHGGVLRDVLLVPTPRPKHQASKHQASDHQLPE